MHLPSVHSRQRQQAAVGISTPELHFRANSLG